jgi:hypothetical protein
VSGWRGKRPCRRPFGIAMDVDCAGRGQRPSRSPEGLERDVCQGASRTGVPPRHPHRAKRRRCGEPAPGRLSLRAQHRNQRVVQHHLSMLAVDGTPTAHWTSPSRRHSGRWRPPACSATTALGLHGLCDITPPGLTWRFPEGFAAPAHEPLPACCVCTRQRSRALSTRFRGTVLAYEVVQLSHSRTWEQT